MQPPPPADIFYDSVFTTCAPPPRCSPQRPHQRRPLPASQIARSCAITVSAMPGTINLSRERAANSIHFWCVFNYRHNCCDGMRSPSTLALKVEGAVRINQVSRQQSRSLCHIPSVSPLHSGERFLFFFYWGLFPTKDTLIESQCNVFFVLLIYDLSGWVA